MLHPARGYGGQPEGLEASKRVWEASQRVWRPARGSGRPARGSERPARGSGRPARGPGRPASRSGGKPEGLAAAGRGSGGQPEGLGGQPEGLEACLGRGGRRNVETEKLRKVETKNQNLPVGYHKSSAPSGPLPPKKRGKRKENMKKGKKIPEI